VAGVAEQAVQLKKISVRGVVQGVGFRPFVYRLAHDHGLTGWVLNHSGGVEIEVEGPAPALDAFVHDLTAQAPPLARIVGVDVVDAPANGYTSFEIRHSVAEEGRYQLISPDIATCADCRRELLDPDDRRYRYPFTNCTNCGPRFTIIRDIPYDRPLTTMAPFPMCPDCQREYDDPLDRRFHAQPNACPVCGPHVWLEATPDPASAPAAPLAERDEAICLAGQMLLDGEVLAIKGLGGFHLACDATNAAAVRTLRARKGRPAKPLAVMMATLDDVRRHCYVSKKEKEMLTGQQCPIVLLRWRDDSTVVREVAPGNLYLGVMLPYTPLHHILLRDVDRPLVMTSGNLSEEPIARDNDEARRRLGPLADAFLLHNRDIYARYDDSVLANPRFPMHNGRHLIAGIQYPIRRSRGYAPFPIRLPFKMAQILAVGAELKNTFCLTRDDFAFLSQHIGDMENLETLQHFESSIELFKHLFRVEPELVAYDLHPDYFATKYAKAQSPGRGALKALLPIQHHQAHVASCLADNGRAADDGPVIGVAWDGTGYGLDGAIWGGEWFVGDYRGLERVAHLEYLPMPGGEVAIRHPWRLALGYVYALSGKTPALAGVTEQKARIVRQQIDRDLNAPRTSAAGRLFDAVAALAGVRGSVTYEAQAAIELEMLATRWAASEFPSSQPGGFGYSLDRGDDGLVVHLDTLLDEVQEALAAGATPGEIGWRFHWTMAHMIGFVCQRIARDTGRDTGRETAPTTVALSGGVFQNRLLLALTVPRLEHAGFRVLLHRQVPCNDGGLSLGQAVMAHFAAQAGELTAGQPGVAGSQVREAKKKRSERSVEIR
jgi:hydrogenase maturation protein HypF